MLPAAQLATGLTSPKPHLRGQRGLWLLGLCCAQLTLGVPDPQGRERAHPRQLWGPLSPGLCYCLLFLLSPELTQRSQQSSI